MSDQSEWRPRISVATDEAQFLALQKAIPWGMRDKLFRAFASELIRITEAHGPTALMLLYTKGFTVVLKEEELHG